MSLVSINDVLKITTKVEKIHPYKVFGDRDSYSPYNEGWSDCVSLIESYLEKMPFAEQWIPVTEALPQNYQQTICIDSRGKMMIGTYGEYGWTFPCYMNEPVAWMPLPEPWRGE